MAAALSLNANPAYAEDLCSVRFHPPSRAAALAWQEAVRTEQHALVEQESDCRELKVDVDEDGRGALVTFTTRDGRVAERHIDAPAELRATAEALLVTIPPAPPPQQAEEPQPARSPALSDPSIRGPSLPSGETGEEPPRPAGGGSRFGVLVGAGAGVAATAGELGGAGQVRAGLATDRWEFGLAGQVEPERDGKRATGHVSTSVIGAGAYAARRAVYGPVVVLLGGGAGLAVVSEEARRGTRQHPAHGDLLEPRLGVMVGVIGPTLGRWRLRSQLEAQVGLGSHAMPDVDPAGPPQLTAALTVGVETTVFP
jgi:hypothetical protein